MKRTIEVFSLLTLAGTLSAQDLDFSAELDPVHNNGYHEIALSPELIGRSRTAQADLRIFDSSDKKVPYFIRKDEAYSQTKRFIPFKIVKKEIYPNSHTEIIFEQSGASALEEIHLEVANAEVNKPVEITGSDNQEQWYAIKSENVQLRPRNNGKTTTLSIVNLPPSSHRFFRLTVGDSLSPPLKILDLGHQGSEKILGRYDEASGYQIITKSDEKSTKMFICSAYPLLYNRLRFSADPREQFHRRVIISDYNTPKLSRRQRRNKRIFEPARQLYTSTITSSKDNHVELGGLYIDTLLVEIFNGDDDALQTLDIHVENLRHSAIAKLDSGVQYTIRTGNDEISRPQYDLYRFVDDNTEIHGPISHDVLIDHREANDAPLGLLSRNWMWLIIGALTLFMLYMVSKMMRDQQNKTTNEDR